MTSATRYGHPGGDGGGQPPSSPEPCRGARTLLGRPTGDEPRPRRSTLSFGRLSDLAAPPAALGRLTPVHALGVAGGSMLPPPRPRAPSHTGKSNFPARAGFWGRRNTAGAFEAFSCEDTDILPWSRWTALRRRAAPLLVVLASAALSFVAVTGVVRLLHARNPHVPAGAPAPAPLAPASPVPAPSPPAAPAPPIGAPSQPAAAGPAAAPAGLAGVPATPPAGARSVGTEAPTASNPGRLAPLPRRDARPASRPRFNQKIHPDALLPPQL